MDSISLSALPTRAAQVGGVLFGIFTIYIVYMRFFHPLAKYPGPLLASLTNVWRAYWVYKLSLHEKLVELHFQYGPVVRIGPNHLHFWDGDAIAPIYKGGRMMGKTEFYHAFTAFNPNLFGGTDENVSTWQSPVVSICDVEIYY